MRFSAPLYLSDPKQPPLHRYLPRILTGLVVVLAIIVVSQVFLAFIGSTEAFNQRFSLAVGAFLLTGILLLVYRIYSQRIHGYVVLTHNEIQVKVGSRPWIHYPLHQVEELHFKVNPPQETSVMAPPGASFRAMPISPNRPSSIAYHNSYNELSFKYRPVQGKKADPVQLEFLIGSPKHYAQLTQRLKQWQKQNIDFEFEKEAPFGMA